MSCPQCGGSYSFGHVCHVLPMKEFDGQFPKGIENPAKSFFKQADKTSDDLKEKRRAERLEIASRILAGFATRPNFALHARDALELADELIKQVDNVES